jgi:hypothetical protein
VYLFAFFSMHEKKAMKNSFFPPFSWLKNVNDYGLYGDSIVMGVL